MKLKSQNYPNARNVFLEFHLFSFLQISILLKKQKKKNVICDYNLHIYK